MAQQNWHPPSQVTSIYPSVGNHGCLFWNLWSTSGSLAAWNAWTGYRPIQVVPNSGHFSGFASIVLLFFFQITWFRIIFVKILEYPGTLSKSVYCSYDLSWSSSNQGRYLQQNLAPLLDASHRMDLAISTKKRKEPQPVNLSAPANKCQCGHVSILPTPRVESAATQNAKMLEDHSKRSPWQLKRKA